MVGQHQHAQREALSLDLHNPGGGANAALQIVADHALARAYISLGKIGRGAFNSGEYLFLSHRPVPDVIERAVVALADHRVHRLDGIAPGLCLAAHVLHHGVMDQAHVQGVGQGNGGLQGAQLPDLHQPRRFAEAVKHMAGRHHLLLKNIIRTGQDHRHAGFVPLAVHSTVAHPNAGYIRNGVPGSWLHPSDLQIHNRSS